MAETLRWFLRKSTRSHMAAAAALYSQTGCCFKCFMQRTSNLLANQVAEGGREDSITLALQIKWQKLLSLLPPPSCLV
ncbi:hypothetical protein MLD38_019772 [Melastoma candidum]|uniref:Uncharacterized protein n=1 Tax=Melastoma candidum TaxID=119954 RepID=A0ACB9QZC6_9MYRT|nr:hypothetical protein MLD38_019772 [Melastoma candidum]